MSELLREAVLEMAARLRSFEEQLKRYDQQITQLARNDPRAHRLMTVPGVGPVIATALLATIGDACQFKSGRELSAWLGLVPRCELARAEPVIDQPAPPLVLTTLDGQAFDLEKLRDKVVLINFWATWCAPCRKEIPRLGAFYKRYRERGLEVIGISIDRPSDLEKVRRQMTSIAYPVAVLKDIAVNGLGKPEGVPVTYVIDSSGVVRDKFIELRNELLNDVVVPLLPK